MLHDDTLNFFHIQELKAMKKITIDGVSHEFSTETIKLIWIVLKESVDLHRDMYDLHDDPRLVEIETLCKLLI